MGMGGLFTKYSNKFLHIKTQASGYQDSVHSLEQRQEYIEEYTSNEGVILDPKLRSTQYSKASIEFILWKVLTVQQHI